MDVSTFPTIYGEPLTVERFIEYVIKRDAWLFSIINRIDKYFEFVDLSKKKLKYVKCMQKTREALDYTEDEERREMIIYKNNELINEYKSLSSRLDEVKKEMGRPITGTFAEVNEFKYKICSGHSIMREFREYFSKDPKYEFCRTLYRSFLARVHSYLTTTSEGKRFQKYMMEELSPEDFKEAMDVLDIRCSSATVEQSHVSIRVDKNKIVSFK